MNSQPRSSQRDRGPIRVDELRFTKRIVELACEYGRYKFRRITALLRQQGIPVNHRRVERIWRREGLKVPRKQPKRGRLWLSDGSCVRQRAQYPNHLWSYDLVFERTHDDRPLRILAIVDECTRESLALRSSRRMTSQDVIYTLSGLFVEGGAPACLRSDTGRSLPPRLSEIGWNDSKSRRSSSDREVPGKTAMLNPLTANSETNY